MQDELNEKVVALVIKLAKKELELDAKVLKAAMRQFVKMHEKHKVKVQSKKQGTHGKKTVAKLMEENQGLTNIEITDRNIKDFERVARKYNIDFALKKDPSSELPKYVVFFKSRDVDVMTHAFKEYSTRVMKQKEKPSVKKRLMEYVEKSKAQAKQKDKNRQRQKNRNRGQEL